MIYVLCSIALLLVTLSLLAEQISRWWRKHRSAKPHYVVVAGKRYEIARPTMRLMQEVLLIIPELGYQPQTKIEVLDSFDKLYELASVILVDRRGEHPSIDLMMEELDFEQVQEIVQTGLPHSP